jgi:NADPH2:quinone reductase
MTDKGILMTYAIQIDEFGGPEVMQWREIELPPVAAGTALIRQEAVGLNFIDTYHRSGLYPLELPSGIGTEAAGVVTAIGAGVTGLAEGDRVAYAGLPPGSYAQERVYPADRLVRIPDGITADIAAASMLKGLTAWYLVRRSYPVQPGDNVLIYAAAGGVGQIACQWAASIGARVIGVVGTEAKATLARANGCQDIVFADDADFVGSVRRLTNEQGVAAVYDSVGKDTFFQSLDCLRPHGTMVTYGNASGAVEPFSPMELAKRGSLYVTRPVIFDFVRERADLESAAAELFELIQAGTITVQVKQKYPLENAAAAHADLESRKTVGATILVPWPVSSSGL